jgi:hypothetical protein
VIFPNVAALEESALGVFQFGWLAKLNPSNLNCKEWPSRIVVFLTTERSHCRTPGLRRTRLPTLPYSQVRLRLVVSKAATFQKFVAFCGFGNGLMPVAFG